MTKINKLFVAVFTVMVISGFSFLKAQSPVSINIQPVKGETSTYTLTISPYTQAAQTALAELSTQGRILTVVSSNHQTGEVKITSPMGDAEGIKNYVIGYVDYKSRETNQGKVAVQPSTR